MITGKFFIADERSSIGVSTDIFRYKAFCNKDALTVQERYPIYLAFKTHSIEFNFQGKIQTDNNSLDYFFSTAPILSIPFNTHNETEVKNIFNRVVSIKPYFKKDSEGVKYKYGFRPTINAATSYSNLPVFGFQINEDWSVIHWEIAAEYIEAEDLRYKFLRRLLLDFLEDFFNANVFRQSTRHEYIKEKILSSYILNGIRLKAEFYLRKTEFQDTFHDTLKLDRYFISFDTWTEFVTDDEHQHLFTSEKKSAKPEEWFDFSDRELTDPLLYNKVFLFKKHSLKSVIVNRSVTYLIKHYEIGKATFITLTYWKYISGIFLVLFVPLLIYLYDILSVNHHDNFSSNPILFFIIPTIVIIPAVIYWCLGQIFRKLKVSKTNHFLYIRIYDFASMIFILVPFVTVIWLYCSNSQTVLNSQWTWLILYLIVAFILGILFFFASFFFFRPAINLLLPRLQMAVITAWIAILSSLDFWKNSFDISINNSLLYGTLLITFTASYLWFEIKRNTHLNSRPKLLWKVLNVIIPGYILSLTIGVCGMSLLADRYMTHTDFFEDKVVRENIFELMKYDSLQGNYQEDLDALRDSALLFPKYSLDSSRITTFWSKKVYNDSLEIPKLIYGNKNNPRLHELHLINVDGRKSLQHVAYIYKINVLGRGELNLILIPGFLILMSATALFSGIFLTLLFDDKPVTDPL